jgi:ribose transport system substrate-binding protein
MNPRRAAGCAVMVAVVALTAACSSSSSSNGRSSTPPSSGTAPATANSDGLAPGAAASAKALVDQISQRPTKIFLSTPLPKKPPTGKTIDFLACSIPGCTGFVPYLKKAASYFGWTIRVVNAGLTPATIKAAWQQAVRDKPDGVFASGNPRALFEPELQKLKSMGIPFVDLGVLDPAGNGISSVVMGENVFSEDGKIFANWMVNKLGSKVHALSVSVSGFPAPQMSSDAFNTEYARLCPNCKLDKLSFTTQQFGTPAIANGIVAYMKGHPDINAIACPFPDVFAGLATQLKNAGLKDVLTITGGEGNIYNDVKEGKISATVFEPQVEWVYQVIDTFARIFTNASLEPEAEAAQNIASQFWLTTADTIPAEASQEYFPLVADYDAQFKQLWGISG